MLSLSSVFSRLAYFAFHLFFTLSFLIALLHGSIRAFSLIFSELWFPSISFIIRDDSNTFLPAWTLNLLFVVCGVFFFLISYRALNIISGIPPKLPWSNKGVAVELFLFLKDKLKNSNILYQITLFLNKNLSQKKNTDLTFTILFHIFHILQ